MSSAPVHAVRGVAERYRLGVRELTALGAGLILPLAFSPYALWPAALVAPAILFWSCQAGSSARLALRGALFGLASFGLGVSWIHESFQFSNVSLPFAVVLTVAFVAYLSAYPALACAAFARLVAPPGRTRFTAAAAFAGLYVLAEWLRGWLLSGFTWLQLGYSQVDGPLGPLLAVLGVYGTGLLTAAMACCVAAACHAGVRALALGLAAAGLVGAAVTALPRDWSEADGAPLTVAIVQGNVPQDQKWLPAMRVPSLERYLRLTRENLDAALVVWPETSVPAARDRVGPFLEQLRREAAARGASVLVGFPEVERSTGRTFNSTELLGQSSGVYRKRHLVPFGEFLPLSPLLRPVTRALRIPVSDFTPGSMEQPVLRVRGHPVAIFICYEIAFGAEVADRLPEARWLITVSNDAWFGDSLGPLQHLQMARARAMETGRYLVRATNTGVSAVVDPRGRLILRLPQFRVAQGAARIEPLSGATPYVRMGDGPALALCLSAALWAGFSARTREGRRA